MTDFYMTANTFLKYILCLNLKFHHVNYFKKNSKKQLNYWLKEEILGDAMQQPRHVLTSFYRVYRKQLSAQDRALLSLYTTQKHSFRIWLRRFAYRGRLRPSLGGDLALRITFFLNRW